MPIHCYSAIGDKIAASKAKAKGMWMGGPVPLGYAVRDRKLVVVPEDAQMIRHIFSRYLALGCGQKLIEELYAQGYRTKVRQTHAGARGGVPLQRGALFTILSNRIYRGEIVHKGKGYQGEHEPIIDRELWDKAQDLIATNRTAL